MIREYIIKISDEIMEEEIADRPQELVRCKDCKWWNVIVVRKSETNTYYESDTGSCGCYRGIHTGDWFCADGKRR